MEIYGTDIPSSNWKSSYTSCHTTSIETRIKIDVNPGSSCPLNYEFESPIRTPLSWSPGCTSKAALSLRILKISCTVFANKQKIEKSFCFTNKKPKKRKVELWNLVTLYLSTHLNEYILVHLYSTWIQKDQFSFYFLVQLVSVPVCGDR